jgi:hypothetical protein
MKKQFKIILSNGSRSDTPVTVLRSRRISRTKPTLLTIIAVILAFGALTIALIVGYILTGILFVAIIISGLGIVLVKAFQRK